MCIRDRDIDTEGKEIRGLIVYDNESMIDGKAIHFTSASTKFNGSKNCDMILQFLVEDFNDSDNHDINLCINNVFIKRRVIDSSISIDGNWNFNFQVNNKLSNKVDVKTVNKEIYIPSENSVDIQHMDINEISISPITVSIKYIKYSGRLSNNTVYFTVEDENGSELENLYVDESHSQWCYAEYIIPKGAKKLVIKPFIQYSYGESEVRETEIQWFENDFIDIELKNN